MPDEIDRATEQWAKYLEARIENARRKAHNPPKSPFTKGEPTAGDCIDCGERIPAARKKAAPGCVRCVGCQTVVETH